MDKEKLSPKEEVERLCRKLLRQTENMRDNRKMLSRYSIRHSVYLLFYMMLPVAMHLFRESFVLTVALFIGSFVMSLLLLVYMNNLQETYANAYKREHKDATEIMAQLINIVDWEEFRKQQFYKGTDENVSATIKVYYDETQKWMSPVRSGRNYVNIILVLQIIVKYICFLFTILILFYSLKINFG